MGFHFGFCNTTKQSIFNNATKQGAVFCKSLIIKLLEVFLAATFDYLSLRIKTFLSFSMNSQNLCYNYHSSVPRGGALGLKHPPPPLFNILLSNFTISLTLTVLNYYSKTSIGKLTTNVLIKNTVRQSKVKIVTQRC